MNWEYIGICMNREAIITNLRSIWSALIQGDQVETQSGGFIFFCIKILENHWYGIDFKSVRPQYSEIDQIETFLSNIADL